MTTYRGTRDLTTRTSTITRWDLITRVGAFQAAEITIAAWWANRTWRRNYTGKRRANNTQPMAQPDHLLSPAAYQLTTRTQEFIPAGPDADTGLLNARRITPTNRWTVTTPAKEQP